jgi:casein kinase 1
METGEIEVGVLRADIRGDGLRQEEDEEEDSEADGDVSDGICHEGRARSIVSLSTLAARLSDKDYEEQRDVKMEGAHSGVTSASTAASRNTLAMIGGVYKVAGLIGTGTFGQIFQAVHIETKERFAVKVEQRTSNQSVLQEAHMLRTVLRSGSGFCGVHFAGQVQDKSVLVMDLLGPSLAHVFELCGRRFTLLTVTKIALQILQRVEFLHGRNYIHRDIKPENFLIDPDLDNPTIYMVDFGLVKKYRDERTHVHYAFRDKRRSMVGTARYASINAHLGVDQSRRDDMEAIGYLFVYFLRGSLPWQGINWHWSEKRDSAALHERILDKKTSTSVAELCSGCPSEFEKYINYCKALRFDDRPDYGYLRRLFKGYMNPFATPVGGDAPYDWVKRLKPDCGVPPMRKRSAQKSIFARLYGARHWDMADGRI